MDQVGYGFVPVSNFGHSSLPFDLAQGGELVDHFVLRASNFGF
jgi:hypothetical protein